MTLETILKILAMAAQATAVTAQAATTTREAYDKLRAIAASAGATPEQLAEADAVFSTIRPDPLGIVGGGE